MATVEHDEAGQRFVIALGGDDARLMYRRNGQVLDFYYTYVPESHRGSGMAAQVTKAAFEFAKANPVAQIALMAIALTAIDAFGPEGVAPFIYFQF